MNRQADHKIGSLVIHVEFRSRRNVFAHGEQDLRDACGAALCKIQLHKAYRERWNAKFLETARTNKALIELCIKRISELNR